MFRTAVIALFSAGVALLSPLAAASELRVVGTGDGLQLLRDLASRYEQETVGATIVVPDSIGSGGGIAAVSAGEERLARVARILKDSEVAAGLVYVPYSRIPTVFFVHKSAGVSALTSDQIKDIFEGRIRSWSDVGGNDVKVRVVRREEGDSSVQVLRASMPGWEDLVFTERSKLAVTTQDAVDTVRTVEGTIGFAPYSEAIGKTVVLSVDGLEPTDPDYPSAVELAFVYRANAVDADMQSFIDFVRSEKVKELFSSQGALPST